MRQCLASLNFKEQWSGTALQAAIDENKLKVNRQVSISNRAFTIKINTLLTVSSSTWATLTSLEQVVTSRKFRNEFVRLIENWNHAKWLVDVDEFVIFNDSFLTYVNDSHVMALVEHIWAENRRKKFGSRIFHHVSMSNNLCNAENWWENLLLNWERSDFQPQKKIVSILRLDWLAQNLSFVVS